jgi:hypothetical protein
MKKSSKYVSWSVGVIAFVLLLAHTFKWQQYNIDLNSILLLSIIGLVPLFELIRKIKFGDFEAEIAPSEVAKTSAKVQKDSGPETSPNIEENAADQYILELVQTDPSLALAKLRMDIEKVLQSLHSFAVKEKAPPRIYSIGKLLQDLKNREIIPIEISSNLSDVLSLANRAIHGESIRKSDAIELVKTGLTILDELWAIHKDLVVKPKESSEISHAELDKYSNATYRVTTVIPYVKKPIKNTYLLSQSGLDDLLDNYDEYAEFIVSVEQVKR